MSGAEQSFPIVDKWALYNSQELADAEFKLQSKIGGDEKRVTAHKCILAASSPVFRAMFCGDTADTGVINITDVSAEAFEEFVRLIYVGSDHLTLENAAEVIKLINKYEMPKYYSNVREFLHRTIAALNVCVCLQLIQQLPNADDLIQKCMDIIRGDPATVLRSSYFQLLDLATVKYILLMDLKVSESEKFQTITRWADASLERKQLGQSPDDVVAESEELCRLINFKSMTVQQFTKIIRKYPKLMDLQSMLDTVDAINQELHLPLMRKQSGKSVLDVPLGLWCSGKTHKIVEYEKCSPHKAFIVECSDREILLDAITFSLSNYNNKRNLYDLQCTVKLGYFASVCDDPLFYRTLSGPSKKFKFKLKQPIPVICDGKQENYLSFDIGGFESQVDHQWLYIWNHARPATVSRGITITFLGNDPCIIDTLHFKVTDKINHKPITSHIESKETN